MLKASTMPSSDLASTGPDKSIWFKTLTFYFNTRFHGPHQNESASHTECNGAEHWMGSLLKREHVRRMTEHSSCYRHLNSSSTCAV